MEIAFLKERVGNTKDSDDQTMIADSRHQLDDNYRNKRPVRLLPTSLFYREPKNETEQQKQNNRRRYEQPTNCSDLSILGYTLNGFYTVKSNEPSTKSNITNNDVKLETVYCAFKQPEGTFNSSLVEKRIISRRETTRQTSKRIFHATRKTDLAVKFGTYTLTFENILPTSGDYVYNPGMGTFVFPQSGAYLFSFRGNVTFPTESADRKFHITFLGVYRLQPGSRISDRVRFRETHTVHKRNTKDPLINLEFDKVVQINRGDKIEVTVRCEDNEATLFGNSTWFTVYVLNE